jgi:hypothetical protein
MSKCCKLLKNMDVTDNGKMVALTDNNYNEYIGTITKIENVPGVDGILKFNFNITKPFEMKIPLDASSGNPRDFMPTFTVFGDGCQQVSTNNNKCTISGGKRKSFRRKRNYNRKTLKRGKSRRNKKVLGRGKYSSNPPMNAAYRALTSDDYTAALDNLDEYSKKNDPYDDDVNEIRDLLRVAKQNISTSFIKLDTMMNE